MVPSVAARQVVDKDDRTLPSMSTLSTRTTLLIPTFQSDTPLATMFRLGYLDTSPIAFVDGAPRRRLDVEFVVDATFDIVDVYEYKDDLTLTDGTDYEDYTSGLRTRIREQRLRQSATWVTITEVAKAEAVDPVRQGYGGGMPHATTNLFRGKVVITNDTSEIRRGRCTIYAQDGDTLSLQVFSTRTASRSSDLLASATALIDDSPPDDHRPQPR